MQHISVMKMDSSLLQPVHKSNGIVLILSILSAVQSSNVAELSDGQGNDQKGYNRESERSTGWYPRIRSFIQLEGFGLRASWYLIRIPMFPPQRHPYPGCPGSRAEHLHPPYPFLPRTTTPFVVLVKSCTFFPIRTQPWLLGIICSISGFEDVYCSFIKSSCYNFPTSS